MLLKTQRLYALSLILTVPAMGLTQTFPFSGSYDGVSNIVEIIDPGVPIVRFETNASGTGSFGLDTYFSTDIVNMATGAGQGTNIFTAGNGDQLFGSFDVQITPTSNPGEVTLAGLVTFTGGTGLFAGATGSSVLTGLGQFTSQTSAIGHFDFNGEVTLVPEPTTLLLTLPALLLVARRRNRAKA